MIARVDKRLFPQIPLALGGLFCKDVALVGSCALQATGGRTPEPLLRPTVRLHLRHGLKQKLVNPINNPQHLTGFPQMVTYCAHARGYVVFSGDSIVVIRRPSIRAA